MGTYLIMLHVTLCQERALKQLFQDKGWPFLKPDLLSTTQTLGPMPVTNFHKTPNLPAAAAEAQKRQAETATNIQQPEIKRKRVAEPSSVECEQGTAQETEVDHREEEDNLGELLSKTPLQETQEQGCIKLDGTDTAIGDTADAEDNVTVMISLSKDSLTRSVRDTSVKFLQIAKQLHDSFVNETANSENLYEEMEQGSENAHKFSPVHDPDDKAFTDHHDVISDTKSHESKWSCETCGKAFARKYTLGRHLKSHERDQIKCTTCSQYFQNEQQLSEHNEKFHSVCFMCESCSTVFGRKSTLMKHIQTQHPEIHLEKFKCPFPSCKLRFEEEKEYLDHLNFHEGVIAYTCQYCEKQFAEEKHCRKHEAKHLETAKIIICPQCGKSFSSLGALCNHRQAVHDNLRYLCPEPDCGKEFKYHSGYHKHIATHKQGLSDLEPKGGNCMPQNRGLDPQGVESVVVEQDDGMGTLQTEHKVIVIKSHI
ncbi:zinc finger protein 311-like isoform X3 [Mya arenaria]|uniref:zinc finger protein 311-like isoform X3 n=1 Tax=Mya arenaria TaxID=6604 RepID=UPI0022E5A0A5|nr:zinc finger protein 311-like isoform X3 [Mya arenaria]